MKKNSLYTHYQNIIRFGQDESGVYSIIMGLITVFLLIAISFTFEFSGMLMDKARLSDGLEQAALTVVAENNKDRSKNGLSESAAKSRNHWIADKYAILYLPGHNQPDLDVVCGKKYTGKTQNSGFLQASAQAKITCEITGTVNRHTWLPINLNNLDVVPSQSKIGSYGLATKGTSEPLPFDIVFAVELSDDYLTSVEEEEFHHCTEVTGNMRKDIQNYLNWRAMRCKKSSGGELLAQVIKEFSKENLFKGDNAISNNSRISFFPFNFGGQLTANHKRCIIPLVGVSDAEAKNYAKKISPNSDEAYFEYSTRRKYPFSISPDWRVYVNEPLHKFTGRADMAAQIHASLQKFKAGFGFGIFGNGENIRAADEYAYGYFFAKYLPYYIDYEKTVDSIYDIQPLGYNQLEDVNDTSKRFIVNTNAFVCFPGLKTDNYQMSSGWYGRTDYQQFATFMNERLKYSSGSPNFATALIAATQHFVNLGRNPQLPENQATQRLIIMVGTGAEFGLGDAHHLQDKDWFCADNNQLGDKNYTKQHRCYDLSDRKRFEWIKRYSRYYDVSSNEVHIANAPRKSMAYEFNQIGKELIKRGVCQAIRKRLDRLDGAGDRNHSKIIYINYLNRMTNASVDALSKCVDNFYFASNKEELLNAMKKSLERENSQSEEEVGKSRVFK